MTKLEIFSTGLCLLFAASASAQQAEQKEDVVRAEAPIVAGNAVNAKKRAVADAFRQATERAFAELMKTGEPLPSPTPPGVAQLKASLASNAQKFVRSYRLIEQQTEGGVLKVMVEVDVDSVLLRRELDRARGAVGEQAQFVRKPVANVLFVAGSAPAGALVVGALGAAGARSQLDSAQAEAQLLASAARQNAYALFVAAKSAGEGMVRGGSRIAVKCSLGWRLFGAGIQATHGPAVERADEEYGFASDETAARNACFERAASTVARGVVAALRAPVVSAPFVTLQLEIADVGAIPIILQALKRLGSVTANEVRHVTTNAAEIRVFTRISGPALFQALGRELGGKMLLVPTQPVSDVIAVKVRGSDAPSPEENR